MEGIRRDLNNLIVQNATPISPTGGTSKITNPTAKEMGTKCGIGQVPANVIRGGRLGYEIIGSGCVDYYIAQPYLTDDNFAVIPEDIFNSGGLLSPDAIKKAQEWNELKEAYENGEATLQDLKDFDPGVLSGLDGWLDYYNDFISGEEEVVLGGIESTGEFGDVAVILPPLLPPKTESKRTDGGGGLMTGGGMDTGTTGGPGPATESKRTDGGAGDAGDGDAGGEDTGDGDAGTGDGRLDVLGEDWEYDPEHDYIYVGNCTFVRVDENGNPIGEPTVSDYCPDDVYVVGGNYSGPDNEWDPTQEVNVDIFGEGSIIDTTKDNTEPEEKDKEDTEPEEKDKEDTEPEEKDKEDTTTTPTIPTTPTVTTTTTTTQPPTGPTTESKRTDGGGDVGGDIETGTTPPTGPTTESKRTDGTGDGGDGDGGGGDGDGGDGDGDDGTGGGEGVITFENMYGYYGNKDGGDGGGGPATESKGNGDGGDGDGGDGDGGDGDGGDGDGGDGDGGDGGEEGSMFKDMSLGGTSGSAFTPFQAVPGYTAPTYAPINVPQQDYMAAINNLIARNSSMFKGYI